MEPMKLLLLAGAGYLVYSAMTSQDAYPAATYPATGGSGGTTPPPSTTPTGSQNPAAQPPVATQPVSQCSSTPAPSNDALMRAAINRDWIGPVGNYCQNAHQWNYWRQQFQATVGGYPNAAQQTAFDDITDPNKNITAAEYHALLSRKGLSGLRWAPKLPRGGWQAITH